MPTLRFEGIDGQHLFGFLVALGSLSLLDEHAREEDLDRPTLAFDKDGTAVVATQVDEAQVAGVLLAELGNLRPCLESDLEVIKKPSDFTRSSYDSIAVAGSPSTLAFLAGLACVIGDVAFESTLCAANGSSHQNLVQSMRDVINLVEEEHIWSALFEPWKRSYRVPDNKRKQFRLGDRKPTLRLDPADERLYALRMSNPTTTDDFRTELGAQALAVPAFSLLPVVPAKQPVTVASTRHRGRVTFSWPLWAVPSTLLTVRTLLWSGVGNPQADRQRGVFAAFSADRVAGAKGKLSFAPSQGLW